MNWLESRGLLFGHGQAQEFGTDFQTDAPGGAFVYAEADFVAFENEVDHAAAFSEPVHFAYSEHAGPLQAGKDFGQPFFFRAADENNMAVGGLGRGI